MENENEFIDSTIDTETTENEVVEDQFEETTPEIDVEALKKEVQTLKAQKEHWKKKAEGTKPEPKTEIPSSVLKDEDVLYMAKADIHSEDLSLIREHMKNYNVDARAAHQFLKPILDIKAEERRTAQITQTKGGVRAVNKNTGEELLKRAEKGEFPENPDDLDKMLEVKYEKRKSELKK